MAVFLSFSVTLRPFASQPGPGMPLGLWAVHVSTLGDASGGLMTASPRFQQANEPGNTLLYSLEQLGLGTTIDGGQPAVMIIENMDGLPLNGSTGAQTDVYNIPLVDNGTLIGSSAQFGNLLNRPFFLGAARQNNLNAGLQFATVNSDANSIVVKAQGYYWSPGAINAVGGPQRPPGSIYGN